MRHLLPVLIVASTVALAEPPEPRFRPVVLDDHIQIGYGLAIADVDGDKAPDILLADKKQIVWYRNPAGTITKSNPPAPTAWEKFVIAENLTEKDNVCLAAQDIDGDGKCELAVGAEWNPADTEKSGAVFYLIPPADRTQRWTPVKFPSVEPTTHRMKWLRLENGKWGLVVVPLHGRGNKNGAGAPVKVLLYHPPTPLNDPQGEWKSEVMDESMHMTHNFDTQVRPDWPANFLIAGREGIVGVSFEGGKWKAFPNVTSNEAPRGFGEVRQMSMLPVRESRPGYLAVIEPMHGNVLGVLLPRLLGTKWEHRILTEKLTEGHALATGDVLGVGSDQIVVGWRGTPGKEGSTTGVALWAPLDNAGEKWRETVIDPEGMACEDLQLADLDGDGRLDIIAAGRATHNVKIYWNETPKP